MHAQLKETLSSIIGELKAIASTKTVVGDGEGEDVKKRGGFAGGGAGGARIDPIGFIIIDGEKISFLPTKPGRFEGFIDSIPGIVEKFKSPKTDKRGIAEDAEE